MEECPGSQDLEKAPYSLAHNTNFSFFDHLATQPDRARHFADSMGFLMNNPALNLKHVFAYDWAQHSEGTVVDIGGSHGNFAFHIAQRFLQMRVIVQDRPEIITTAPVGRWPNIIFETQDFFTTQPHQGADICFMRYILHKWPESYCLRILEALISALGRGSRIVIMDAIVPEPGTLGKLDERRITASYHVMKALLNAREWTECEWRSLIWQVDPIGRMKMAEVLQPKGSRALLL